MDDRPPSRPAGLLARAVDVRPDEVKALLLSFAYFFCLLSSYYVLRPLREEMGIASGVQHLQWLFSGTFAAMLAAVPIFGWVVARLPRRKFVPLVYRFFAANILIFFALFTLDAGPIAVARAFYIWVSLFNLFVVSVFWSVMADLFSNEQGRRLFGFVAAGGSAGALVGSSLTASLAVLLGPINLLLIAVVLLELAVRCAAALMRRATPPAQADAPKAERAIGGSIVAGFTEVLRSRYLAGICLYMLLFTSTSTFLYFEQANIIAHAVGDPAERTRIFALIDLAVGLLTLLTQLLATGRLIRRLGVAGALAAAPLLTAAGFAALAAAPSLALVVAFQAVRRASNFALSQPAREVLFTVIGREAKYKSKNFIDTAVYRGGDAASGWAFAALRGLGLDLASIAMVAVPLARLWGATGLYLGRREARGAAASHLE
ncbi:MAG: NTP/NDP exchange transporter, partial [Candidatus Eiseniibacteriota bacterium]